LSTATWNDKDRPQIEFSGLPEADFVAGIALDLERPVVVREKPGWFKDVRVKMTLVNVKTKKAVFEVDQTLDRYTWTNVDPAKGTSFLYGRDRVKTSFTPKKGDSCKLLVEIKSDASKSVPASVFVMAGRRKNQT
jgi:hypothetical protein